ncbi:hypothetical protein ONZ45_g11315 [Pleurotus djamor]|nr:hypothetical protein ONZ45_g11315 [Pleurotus djamor]
MIAFLNFASGMLLLAGSALPVAANPAPAPAPDLSLFSEGFFPRAIHLSARQTGLNDTIIPDECQSQCEGLVQLQQCTSTDCLCSDDGSSSIASCLNCALEVDHDRNGDDTEANVAQAQEIMNRYVQACELAGRTVRNETINSPNDAMGVRPAIFGVALVTTGLGAFLL